MANSGSLTKGVFIAAIIAGATYLFGMNADLNPTFMLAWKGMGVWLLAVYAALQARTTDGWLITAVMGFGALGDVLVESDITSGAMAFICGHIIAGLLYLRHRRTTSLAPSQKWLAIVIVPAVILSAWSLTRDGAATLYSLFLSVMAASAWISRFSRYRVGAGAMMFVASDLLIFARMGPLEEVSGVSFLIWALYFGGQVMIVLGVTQGLAAMTSSKIRV